MNGPTQWRCDLRRNGETQAGTIQVIYGGPSENICDGEDYCAFGTDGDNNLFYCDVTDANIEQVWVIGTDYKFGGAGDDIQLFHDESSLHWDLDTHTSGDFVKGVVVAGEGGDSIDGSYVNSADYQDDIHGDSEDDIHGDSEDDIINGHDGDDLITGDAGDDTITGGADDDTISGGTGDDTISGNDGDDNGGVDYIAGNNGDDNLDGGSDDDDLCGDAGADTLYGGKGDDMVWGNGSLDDEDGGPDSDTCDGNGSTVRSCETLNSTLTRPISCP